MRLCAGFMTRVALKDYLRRRATKAEGPDLSEPSTLDTFSAPCFVRSANYEHAPSSTTAYDTSSPARPPCINTRCARRAMIRTPAAGSLSARSAPAPAAMNQRTLAVLASTPPARTVADAGTASLSASAQAPLARRPQPQRRC